MELKPVLFSYIRLVYCQGDYDRVHSYALVYLPENYLLNKDAILPVGRNWIHKLVIKQGDKFEAESVTIETTFF